MEFPTYDEMAKKIAEKALDEYMINDKPLRDWIRIIAEQQPGEDCVSREAVKELLKTEWVKYHMPMELDVNLSFILNKINELPSVTPTRPKGKWIILDECANEGVYCSECHKKVFKLEFSSTMKWRNFKYCPNCGSKMEVEE